MTGTTPPGARSEDEAARWVRDMFGRIAGRYDFANHLLSLNIDRVWRRRLVTRLKPQLKKPGVRVLDICCGTGDLTIALADATSGGVLGGDFCHPMLLAAHRKSTLPFFEADALDLPFPDASLDVITCAFGLRNLSNYRAGLEEFCRVLKPDGTLAILEFSTPPNALIARLYNFYSRHILPRIGGALSGTPGAYQYLPASVSKFPLSDELANLMNEAGFGSVLWERWTAGIVAFHLAHRHNL